MKIKNIAIIAHVDHGKTTLVNTLLQSSNTLKGNQQLADRVMDSNDLEKERGITILAKTTAIHYKDYKINILDTPGHADFSGEVERIMGMVDGVLLVVDAFEGTMPQTRFVLQKAFENNLKPIVVVNKVDRPNANITKALDEVVDLFIDLGADLEDLDFPKAFVSALNNTSSLSEDLSTQVKGMHCLLDLILNEIPDPKVTVDGPMLFQPALLDYNDYVGRIGIGRIVQGKMKVNQFVSCIRTDGSVKDFRIQKLFGFLGLNRLEIEEAVAGDIVGIAGLPDIYVGETVTEVGLKRALPLIRVGEPTVQMTFGTNTSPMAGKEGKFVTSRQIDDRLYRETQKDVSLKVERIATSDEWIVSGRGELHLSILIENMRREGYEFQVSRPRVILKEIDGVTCEPFEAVQVDVPDDYLGNVIELLGNRNGIMETMVSNNGNTRLTYVMSSKSLIGLMTDFLTLTRGYGILNHRYLEYRPTENSNVGLRKLGVLVSQFEGPATSYAIGGIEDRGELLITPGTLCYEGMIVGICNKEEDLSVNITKEKQQTNMRSSSKDTTVVLKQPRVFNLENYLEFINDDELVEITPKSIRLRKKILDTVERKKFDSIKLKAKKLG